MGYFTQQVKRSLRMDEVLAYFGWTPLVSNPNGIEGLCFENEKISYEEVELNFFKAIAACVKDGSYIEMCDEEGNGFRWVFKDGDCTEVQAKVSW